MDSIKQDAFMQGLEQAAKLYADTHIEIFDRDFRPYIAPAFIEGGRWVVHQIFNLIKPTIQNPSGIHAIGEVLVNSEGVKIYIVDEQNGNYLYKTLGTDEIKQDRCMHIDLNYCRPVI